MQKTLTPAERLIVAADFKPSPKNSGSTSPVRFPDRVEIQRKVLDLADSLKGTGVYLKVNSALRTCGYDLIGEIQSRGLRVFADLKLIDIPNTLTDDGVFLREAKPKLLTVVCSAGVSGMKALASELPDTEILGITILTSLKDGDALDMFSCLVSQAVVRFAHQAMRAGIDGLVCSPKEAPVMRSLILPEMTINTLAIRPAWAIVPGDDQNPERIMTPVKAIKAGADRIVVGCPIVKDKNPYDAVMRTIDEIASAVS